VQIQWPHAPPSAYESPLHKHFRSVLGQQAPLLGEGVGGKDLFSNYSRPESPTRLAPARDGYERWGMDPWRSIMIVEDFE